MFHDPIPRPATHPNPEEHRLKATSRRPRRHDPLASVAGVGRILGELRAALPGLTPRSPEDSALPA